MNQNQKPKPGSEDLPSADANASSLNGPTDLGGLSASVSQGLVFRPERFEAALPAVLQWVEELVAENLPKSRSVESFKFPLLPHYYSDSLLRTARVCVVDQTPTVPLGTLGLPEIQRLFPTAAAGITFKNLYFVQRSFERDESLHAHELVHVVQWDFLGPQQFLLQYGRGLLEHGYRNSPLERMAYSLQDHFNARGGRIDFASQIRGQLQRL